MRTGRSARWACRSGWRTSRVATIDRIEVLAVAPDVPTFRYTDHEPPVTTTTTVVRVIDADGAEGAGAYDSDTFGEPDRAPLERLRSVVPRLVGPRRRRSRGPRRDAHGRWHAPVAPDRRLGRRDRPVGPGRPSRRRAAGSVPRRRRPAPVPAYASVELFDDEAAYVDALERWCEVGFTAAKIHAWGDPARDAALLERLRSTFPDLVLMHDAEGRYDRGGRGASPMPARRSACDGSRRRCPTSTSTATGRSAASGSRCSRRATPIWDPTPAARDHARPAVGRGAVRRLVRRRDRRGARARRGGGRPRPPDRADRATATR